MEETSRRLILVGNPNTGKSTLFNKLCGLKQKTGNFPGVTVDKKIGNLKGSSFGTKVIDLPGINSLRPQSPDEKLVRNFIFDQVGAKGDLIVAIASAKDLKRSLFLIDQLRDLNLPMVLVLTMNDLAEKKSIVINKNELETYFSVPVHIISARDNSPIALDWDGLIDENTQPLAPRNAHYVAEDQMTFVTETLKENFTYKEFILQTEEKQVIEGVKNRDLRQNEAILRHRKIGELVDRTIIGSEEDLLMNHRLDKYFLHPIFGYLIFFGLLFVIFQAVFWLAAYPMDWIDEKFAWLSAYAQEILPNGYFYDLISQGLIPGIGGVVIFVPQIAILFFLFALMEESGYMQRVVVLADRSMQRFGMSGKSVIPLISGMACAIPAIMATRTIQHPKERLITILVTPLLTCSARIPVYVILIAIIIPDKSYGIVHLQGLVLMAMYVFGILMALISAFVLKLIIKTKEKSVFVIDLPEYLWPDWKSIGIYVWDKCKAFLFNAGKIIVLASIVLYVLATTGYSDNTSSGGVDSEISLNESYLGRMGQSIEPIIEPLGYDWKIGVAIISSIAAREVFVGTLATIYSIESEDEMKIKDRLVQQKHDNGSNVFTFATCISLLLFYAFSLQCISTIAITYKETNSIKWTSIQFIYMLVLAYLSSLIAYQILS